MNAAIDVRLGERSYRIALGSGLLSRRDAWDAAVPGRHVLLVSDSNVGPLYAAAVRGALPDRCDVDVYQMPAGESHKTLETASLLYARLAALGASRDATVVALGGGVVGDVAGFVAATWMRGIGYVQTPTSLLAMVDSSVGGKTAVDLPYGKNLVGAFHQPAAVLIDIDTLATLPMRELRAGIAEIVKYAAIGDAGFFGRLADSVAPLLAREPAALVEAIETSCRHKAAIVMRDEREAGERALLNFGHTFGHALETASGYSLLHGEAVAIGMVCAARLSARLGLATDGDANDLAALLARYGLPVAVPGQLDPDVLLGHMRLDKKARSGRVRLVLWRGIGFAEIADGVPEAGIRAAIAESLAS
ncbi:MAG TPA: 3-dehydroquinate synthase [Candidatus Saccharimonadia bacterium]|nr:3-dehydroquinate synthase [Candidatus Saccharimonadia bacterium]